MTNANECCGNCRFFDWPLAFRYKGSGSNESFCYRNPPIFIGEAWEEAADVDNWVRPLVSEVEFCGEFQAAIEPKEEGAVKDELKERADEMAMDLIEEALKSGIVQDLSVKVNIEDGKVVGGSCKPVEPEGMPDEQQDTNE